MTHHLDYEPPTGDSWCVECQIVFGTRALAEAHTTEPTAWIDSSCGNCTPCRETYDDPVSRVQAIEAAEDHADQVIFDAWRERGQ